MNLLVELLPSQMQKLPTRITQENPNFSLGILGGGARRKSSRKNHNKKKTRRTRRKSVRRNRHR